MPSHSLNPAPPRSPTGEIRLKDLTILLSPPTPLPDHFLDKPLLVLTNPANPPTDSLSDATAILPTTDLKTILPAVKAAEKEPLPLVPRMRAELLLPLIGVGKHSVLVLCQLFPDMKSLVEAAVGGRGAEKLEILEAGEREVLERWVTEEIAWED